MMDGLLKRTRIMRRSLRTRSLEQVPVASSGRYRTHGERPNASAALGGFTAREFDGTVDEWIGDPVGAPQLRVRTRRVANRDRRSLTGEQALSGELHSILQVAFGRSDEYPHAFGIRGWLCTDRQGYEPFPGSGVESEMGFCFSERIAIPLCGTVRYLLGPVASPHEIIWHICARRRGDGCT
jgi:hypothetical protein